MEKSTDLTIKFFNNEINIKNIVNIKFISIEESFVKVILPDYENIEGIIMFSDLKKGRRVIPRQEAKIGKSDIAEINDFDSKTNIITLSKKYISPQIKENFKKINRDNKVFLDFIKKLSISTKIDVNLIWEQIVYKIIDLYYDDYEENIYPPNILETLNKNNIFDEIENDFNSFFETEFEQDFIDQFLTIKKKLLVESKNIEVIFGISTIDSVENIKNLIKSSIENTTNDFTESIKYTSFPSSSGFDKANFKLLFESKNVEEDIIEINSVLDNIKTNSNKYKCFYKLYKAPEII